MQLDRITIALVVAGLGSALPTGGDLNFAPIHTLGKRGSASVIEAIMPSSSSCDGRGDECTTAEVAGPVLADSMSHFGVTAGVAQAGILSLIAYESNELQYRKNLNQDTNPGRGTANEQSGDFNVEYAEAMGFSGETTATVMNHVSNDTFNFFSGAWYYTIQSACSTARSMESGDADSWFVEYMDNCDGMGDVSTWNSSQPERWEYWAAAKSAFGLA